MTPATDRQIAELEEALVVAARAAYGGSNDEEIEALNDALDLCLALLQVERPGEEAERSAPMCQCGHDKSCHSGLHDRCIDCGQMGRNCHYIELERYLG